MPIYDLFSKRQRRELGELPDVYRYDSVPNKLRVQIAHILRDAFGKDGYYNNEAGQGFGAIEKILARELGLFSLGRNESEKNVIDFIVNADNVEHVLDAVEVAFRVLEWTHMSGNHSSAFSPVITAKAAIAELNGRFQEEGIGYQYESGTLVRIDSQYAHAEITKPALSVLTDPIFAGAQKEFLNAHTHYRAGRNEEAIAEALKAFESTMKTICTKRGWAYNPSDTARHLIDVCIRAGLIPPAQQSEFTGLRTVLEGGVPTVRNKQAGHGAGVTPRSVPGYVAAFALHLTAANILFLAEAEKKLA
jgi:hypothetical protein